MEYKHTNATLVARDLEAKEKNTLKQKQKFGINMFLGNKF